MIISRIKFILILTLAAFFTLYRCGSPLTYDEIKEIELSKSDRFDSLIFEISFEMSYEQFFFYCWKMNDMGVFFPNAQGSKVVTTVYDGYHSPVELSFFPKIEATPETPISELKCVLRYKNFSYYDRKYSIESIVKETIKIMENGYGGRKFISVPNGEGIVKNHFVKIDGNREIKIIPRATGDAIDLIFRDLKSIENSLR
ncbi:MAG: hypothetical protein ACO2ZZ_11895 [Cyclobacteriaceae bacterium]